MDLFVFVSVANIMDRMPKRKFLIELEFDLFIWVVHISFYLFGLCRFRLN